MSRTLRIGLNPYGFAYTLGLQGMDSSRRNPEGLGLAGFVAAARDIGARCIELDHRWLTPLSDEDLHRLAADIAGMEPICSFWLAHTREETLAEAVRCARALGGSLIRLHLTPVLEGARAAWGARWIELLAHARETLHREASRVTDAGLSLALENHQDLGSEELLVLASEAGAHVGLVLDTGNPFAVGEDPVAFAERVGPRVRHVHLKDYRAQFTSEGFRLIRCAIGDGCVPFAEIVQALASHQEKLTASLEPGALEGRHVRAFSPDWWNGYPPRAAKEFACAIGRLRQACVEDTADARTPWEREALPAEIVEYEMQQLQRSVEYVRRAGWL